MVRDEEEKPMTELKTLKDLEEKGLLNGYTHGEFSLVHVPKLKAEAVKHLKIKKEINTADWVEFFGIEEEFGELCFGKEDDLK